MAEVWAARRADDGPSAPLRAVKIMLPVLAADPRLSEMFAAEVWLAARLKHPNVCDASESGQADGLPYLAMEWIDGASLCALVSAAGRPLPYGIAARIILDAAIGLEAVHALRDEAGRPLGIVHRDISPQNIMIARDGMTKVVDFGVAKVSSGRQPLTQPGYMKGKVEYMSPEQAYCEEVGRESDIFSLGVVLYEASTGHHPFAAATQVATLVNLSNPDAADSPAAIDPAYPKDLADVIEKAIRKEATERYPTMAAFASAIEAALPACGPATRDDVASFLTRVSGEALRERDELLRAARAVRPSAPATARTSASLPARRPHRGTWFAFAAGGMLGIGLIGALAGTHHPSTPHEAPSSAEAVAVATVRSATPEPVSPASAGPIATAEDLPLAPAPSAPPVVTRPRSDSSRPPMRERVRPSVSADAPAPVAKAKEDILKSRE
jgi:serine/threonine-protein kinase